MNTSMRVGFGYDVHKLAEGIPFALGGIIVPHTMGPVAHSDGDVLIHALCDAILGAACMGDIGLHFPDTAEEFKGIDSKELLSQVIQLVRDKGAYRVVNMDATVSLERPKLRKHIDAMREELAGIMEIDIDCVNIKATTTEKLGFVGREEGVAAQAVVLLAR